MGRAPRQHAAGAIYHVTLRGNHAAPIFDTPHNRQVLDGIVGDVLLPAGAVAHAYCWMTNHVHLLLQVGDVPSAALMHDIAGRYSRHVQHQRGTRGQLFDGRYFAQLVTTDRYMLAAASYIHLNPVRAGLAPVARAYAWSGHRAYAGTVIGPPWLRTSLVLGILGVGHDAARAAYLALTEGRDAASLPSPFRPRRERTGPRKGTIRPWAGADPGIAQRVAAACGALGVEPGALRGRLWKRRLVELRAILARTLVATGNVTLRGLARELGCSHAALSRAMARRATGKGEM